MQTIKISSEVFEAGGSIPSKYTCDGDNVNPPLLISDVPEGAKSLVLIMDDPDIPDSVKQSRGVDVIDHWVVFNIPPDISRIAENTNPVGVVGANISGQNKYVGPCPPDKEHRYFFKIYAVDSMLDLPDGSTADEVEKAMEGHIVASGELMGRYNKIKK